MKDNFIGLLSIRTQEPFGESSDTNMKNLQSMRTNVSLTSALPRGGRGQDCPGQVHVDKLEVGH